MQILTPPDTIEEHSKDNAVSIQAKAQSRRFDAGKFVMATAFCMLNLAVMLACVELFLALNHIGEQEYLRVDPVIGFAHLEKKLVSDRSESLGIAPVNSDGLCDVEHTIAKSKGVQRIALMGDSITEALQVPLEQRFARVLEQKLNADSPEKFEIVNFGVGGFGTGQEYLQYIKDVRRYKPQQVILMYHQGDETENSPDGSKWSLQPTFTLNKMNEPQIRYQEFDAWRKSSSAAPLTFFDWGRRHSHIWQCLLQTHNLLKNEPIYKRITDLFEKVSKGLSKLCRQTDAPLNQEQGVRAERERLLHDARIDLDNQSTPAVYEASKQWLLTKQLIGLLNKECHQDGAKLSIAFVPALEKSVDTRPDFHRKIEELTRLGENEDFYTIDLSQTFYDAEKETTRPIILTAHLSPRGHQMVAQEIVERLLKQQNN